MGSVTSLYRNPLMAYPRSHDMGCTVDTIEQYILYLLNRNTLCHNKIQVILCTRLYKLSLLLKRGI